MEEKPRENMQPRARENMQPRAHGKPREARAAPELTLKGFGTCFTEVAGDLQTWWAWAAPGEVKDRSGRSPRAQKQQPLRWTCFSEVTRGQGDATQGQHRPGETTSGGQERTGEAESYHVASVVEHRCAGIV